MTNFNANSIVIWNGLPLVTDPSTPPILAAAVPNSILGGPSQAIFLVRTPTPTGGFVYTQSYGVTVAQAPRRLIEALSLSERRELHDRRRF
jgi:hypothetical protein